jgi:hypothetical protein
MRIAGVLTVLAVIVGVLVLRGVRRSRALKENPGRA